MRVPRMDVTSSLPLNGTHDVPIVILVHGSGVKDPRKRLETMQVHTTVWKCHKEGVYGPKRSIAVLNNSARCQPYMCCRLGAALSEGHMHFQD